MEIRVQQGDITSASADAIVVNLFEGVTSAGGATGAVDSAMGGAICGLISAGDVRGKLGEFTLVHSLGRLAAPRVVVAGLGKSGDFSYEKIRNLSADLARYLRGQRLQKVAVVAHGAGIGGLEPERCTEAIAEGTLLGLYRFLRHKKAEDEPELESVTIIEQDASKLGALERGVETGRIMAEATNFARDLANEPANYLTPTEMAEQARRLAAATPGLECEVFGPDWMREKRMGSLLGVAAGSVEEPRFIVLRYAGGAPNEKPVALVGKGITFDTGGISIKPAENMGEMKGDMSGGASVIAAMGANREARAAAERHRRRAGDGEYAQRQRDPAWRRARDDARQDDRGDQYGCGGASRPSGRPRLRAGGGRDRAGRRGNADRRDQRDPGQRRLWRDG